MEAGEKEKETEKEKEAEVEIEYVTEEPEIYDPNYIFFKRIFEAFKVTGRFRAEGLSWWGLGGLEAVSQSKQHHQPHCTAEKRCLAACRYANTGRGDVCSVCVFFS